MECAVYISYRDPPEDAKALSLTPGWWSDLSSSLVNVQAEQQHFTHSREWNHSLRAIETYEQEHVVGVDCDRVSYWLSERRCTRSF